MDFNFSEDTVMLKNNAERFLKEKCTSSFVKDMIKDEKGFSPAMWKEMADLGWLGLIHDEKYGGLAMSFFDLFVLFNEIGKVLLPSPFFCSAILAGLAIHEAGNEKIKESDLPSIIQGERIFTLALLDEQGRYDLDGSTLEARGAADGSYTLNGTRLMVPFAHVADAILVCAAVKESKAGGATLFKVQPKKNAPTLMPLDTITAEKTFAVVFDQVKVPAENVIGAVGKGATYLKQVLSRASLLKCAEMVGGLEKVLEMTVEYAKQRHQFGRPLGSLQVIQHYLADMATLQMTSWLAAYQAATLLSEGLSCEKEISMAKAWISDAYKKATWTAHQIHGGIGFSEEHHLHLYYKHAKACELAFGDSTVHRGRVAEAMIS